MPSNNVRTFNGPFELEDSDLTWAEAKVIGIVCGPFLFFFVALTFGSFGIKAYVLSVLSREDFKPCKALYLYDYTAGTFGASTALLCLYSMAAVCTFALVEERRKSTVCLIFALGVLHFAGLNFIVFFGGNLSVWLPIPTPEEFLMFYPQFYEDEFDKCASGGVLEVLRLGNRMYKVENFVVMAMMILAAPCLCLFMFFMEQCVDNGQEGHLFA